MYVYIYSYIYRVSVCKNVYVYVYVYVYACVCKQASVRFVCIIRNMPEEPSGGLDINWIIDRQVF